MERAVVLLSGGLDSSTNLYMAKEKFEVVLGLTIHYGQRAAEKEIEVSQRLCRRAEVPHKVVHLPFVKDFGQSALLDTNRKVPIQGEVQIDDLVVSLATAQRVWVPNRNGILLNVAAGFAESLGADVLIPGFNKEEATTFPDNTREFMRALDRSFKYSTGNGVRVECFTIEMNKTEIMRSAVRFGVPIEELWPCYFGYEKICGECESCKRFIRAKAEAGVAN